MKWLHSVYHDHSEVFCCPPHPGLGGIVRVIVRVLRGHPLTAVFLRTAPEGEQEMQRMIAAEPDEVFDYFAADLEVSSAVIGYRFLLITPEQGLWYTAAGLSHDIPLDIYDFKLYAENPCPEWAADSVFYQIFPDRFCNGDPSNNIGEDAYVYNGKKPRFCEWDSEDLRESGHIDFYGGDLPGIESRLDYLEELGVNALYLTPVFHAPSNHKYDTQDYDTVDPHFGGNEALASLTSALRERDMRIVLDAVFNHIGIAHRWFNKSGFYEGGAWQDPDSPYRDFFIFEQWPDKYACWKGVPTLPKLNFRSETLRNLVYRSSDAIAKKWMCPPYAIDGWRFDVANMMGRFRHEQLQHEVWRELRGELKGVRPDCLLLGEHFFDGTDLAEGDMLDSLMNYQGFTFPLWKWITGQDSFLEGWERVSYTDPFSAEEMAAQLRTFRGRYGHQMAQHMFNQLNTHDTPRFINLASQKREQYLLGVVLLFTYVGIPCVYYGDEIGLGGGADPDNRRPMPWDEAKWDHDLLDVYRRLISLRRKSSILKYGGLMELYVSEHCFAFARVLGRECIITVLHHGPQAAEHSIPVYAAGIIDGTFSEYLGGSNHACSGGILHLTLEKDQAMVLLI